MNKGFGKETFKCNVMDNVRNMFRRTIDEVTPQQVFQAVAYAMEDVIIDERTAIHKEYEKEDTKTVYYLSVEFPMDRILGNNIISIRVRNETRETLDEVGFDLSMIEDQEPDTVLGNGDLGRLVVCFLDLLATLGYPAYGCGICRRRSTFKQKTENGYQAEVSDNWLKDGNPFEIRRLEYTAKVKFGGYVYIENQGEVNHFVQDRYQSVRTVPYDLPVIGYGNNVVNTLRTWDAEPINTFNLDPLGRGDYQKAVEQENLAKTITEVFYPDNNRYAGKELCLKQQYFFISASVRRAVREHKEKHDDIRKFYEKVVPQPNDTHLTVAIPESTWILLDEEGLTRDETWEVTIRTCAYTDHTIMSEVLEKRPIKLFSRLPPRIYQIVEEVNRRSQNQIQTTYPDNQERLHKTSIICNGQTKMTYMAIAASLSASGAMRLHTEILRYQELKDFHGMMPERLNNKTNGITQGWLLFHGNPLLVDWVVSKIGDEWVIDLSYIKRLELFAEDEKYQFELMDTKYQNKLRSARYTKENNGIDADPRSISDVQVKRLHEYKHQLMNIFHVTYLYNQLKDNPGTDTTPRTLTLGAKAIVGYKRAKPIIKLTNSVADVINNDESINSKIKVMFIEGYRVSNAELIFTVADVNEQTPTADKEVPGTSNIRFILGGALTLGTVGGANVETMEEVGTDSTSIFGMSSDEVTNYENNGGYYPMDVFNNDQGVRRVFMQLINDYYTPGNPELLRGIYNFLLSIKSSDRVDTHFILKDLRSYVEAHQRVDKTYRDQTWWAKAAILNMANCGRLTSDHVTEEYMKDIWHLKKVTVEM